MWIEIVLRVITFILIITLILFEHKERKSNLALMNEVKAENKNLKKYIDELLKFNNRLEEQNRLLKRRLKKEIEEKEK